MLLFSQCRMLPGGILLVSQCMGLLSICFCFLSVGFCFLSQGWLLSVYFRFSISFGFLSIGCLNIVFFSMLSCILLLYSLILSSCIDPKQCVEEPKLGEL